MGFGEDEMLFYIDKGNDEYEDKNINDVVCKLDIKEGDGGYIEYNDKNKLLINFIKCGENREEFGGIMISGKEECLMDGLEIYLDDK